MSWHHPEGNCQDSHWEVHAKHLPFSGTSNAGEKENCPCLSIPLRGGSCYKEWLILKRNPSRIWFLLFQVLLLTLQANLRQAVEIHSPRAQLNLVVKNKGMNNWEMNDKGMNNKRMNNKGMNYKGMNNWGKEANVFLEGWRNVAYWVKRCDKSFL